MKNAALYVLLCIAVTCSSTLSGQIQGDRDLETKIDSLIPTAVNDSTPGLVIGIVQNGQLIFSKGYGLANLAYKIPNDSRMLYNIGSVSKQFLGYAFAMLHAEGSLNLDDPVNKYLEDWPVFDYEVTLRHLLTHTSGYREAYTMSELAGRGIGVDRLSREECLNVVRKQPQLEFIPGSRYTYNSTAWVILAEIFEKVKGQSAEDWINAHMLVPLGMTNTEIETYVGEVIENAAESYTLNETKDYVNPKSNRAIFGAAEVFSCVEDLVKWINNYKTAEIGGEKVRDLFIDPFILSDGTNSEYALGIGNDSYRGLKRYSHTGGHEGFASQISYFPEADLGIIMISNFSFRGWVSSDKIADIVLEEVLEAPADPVLEEIKIEKEKLEEFAGLYLRSTLNSTVTLTAAGDTLKLNDSHLIPVDMNAFSIDGWEGRIKIETGADGNSRLTTITSAAKNIYNRVDPWDQGIEDLKVYQGDYWSKELETLYHLILKDEKLTIQHRWLGEMVLEPITKDIFKTDWNFVKFLRDEEGDISGFSVNSGRTLNVIFDRKE